MVVKQSVQRVCSHIFMESMLWVYYMWNWVILCINFYGNYLIRYCLCLTKCLLGPHLRGILCNFCPPICIWSYDRDIVSRILEYDFNPDRWTYSVIYCMECWFMLHQPWFLMLCLSPTIKISMSLRISIGSKLNNIPFLIVRLFMGGLIPEM